MGQRLHAYVGQTRGHRTCRNPMLHNNHICILIVEKFHSQACRPFARRPETNVMTFYSDNYELEVIPQSIVISLNTIYIHSVISMHMNYLSLVAQASLFQNKIPCQHLSNGQPFANFRQFKYSAHSFSWKL